MSSSSTYGRFPREEPPFHLPALSPGAGRVLPAPYQLPVPAHLGRGGASVCPSDRVQFHPFALAVVGLLFLTGTLLFASAARAGGLEYAGGGATALGRGGAVMARADNPLVLSRNPAGLAELRGSQLYFSLDYARLDACVTPFGRYGWSGASYMGIGGYGEIELQDPATGRSQRIDLRADDPVTDAYYRDAYDQVCLDQRHTPIPEVALSFRLTERLGLGFGFVFPVATPTGLWGSENGVIQGNTDDLVPGDLGLRPAATRYLGLRAGALGLFPTIGFGFRLADWLRVGAAFEWGLFAVSARRISPSESGTSPHRDSIVDASAEDFFVPAMQASIHLVPFDALDLVLGFRYQDDLNASGRTRVTTGVFDPNLVTLRNSPLEVRNLNQAFPMKFWTGLRFAHRLRPRPAGTGLDEGDGGVLGEPIRDAFSDELWDMELDVIYEVNSRVEALDVTIGEAREIYFQGVDGSTNATTYPASDSPPVYFIKDWQDQISVRFGGSYNLIPGLFGLSAGAHYETRGVNPDYMQIDFFPVERLGLHVGLMVRLAGWIDLSIAYAHIFQESITVAAPPHDESQESGIDKRVGVAQRLGDELEVVPEEPLVEDPDGVAALRQIPVRQRKGATIVNAGRYETSMDVFSAAIHLHF